MDWQINSISALQQIPGLTGLMTAFSFLGREEFFLLLIPLAYLCIDARSGIRLGVLVLTGDALNYLAKLAFHAPRPYWIDSRVQALTQESSYGFPSSHAQNAASVWLFVATLLKRPWAWIGAVCLILLISLSRVYLGVHFWTDVLGGWLIGIAFLLLFVRLWPRAEAWFIIQGWKEQLAVTAAFSFLLLIVGIVVRQWIGGTNEPLAWNDYAEQARSLQPLVGRCGALFGLGVGWALSMRWARFEAGGSLGKRLARFGIGLLGVLACWKGLQLVFPREPEVIELCFRFLRYALLSLWVTFIAPWLFLQWKLAEPAPSVKSEPAINGSQLIIGSQRDEMIL